MKSRLKLRQIKAKLHSVAFKRKCISLCITIIVCIGGIAIAKERQVQDIQVLSKIGSRGDEVRRIQQKLKALGFFEGAVDGIYGVKTQSAVRRFQKSVGIPQMGLQAPKPYYILD